VQRRSGVHPFPMRKELVKNEGVPSAHHSLYEYLLEIVPV